MINMKSPRDSVGFHADPVVIVHSSEVNGHSRRQKFIIVTVVATLVLSALVIGAVLLVKNLSARSARNAAAHYSAPKYLVSFDPAIKEQQLELIMVVLKQGNPSSQISTTVNGEINIEGGATALDDAKTAFKIAIDFGVTLFYSITDVTTDEILFQHCANPHDVRCNSDVEIVQPEQQLLDIVLDSDNFDNSNCPPGFKGPDCTECVAGRYGTLCEFECGDCGRGVCNDGINGDGQCICPEGFAGNCKECLPGRYGPDCLQVCTCKKDWGICDDGLNGSGQCKCINNHVIGDDCDRCDVGWTGAQCTLFEGSSGLNAFNYCGDKPNLIALTYDGWPTAEILDELRSTDTTATFFVRPGLCSPDSCNQVKLAVELGHSIQLGGHTGESMKTMTAEQIDLQIRGSLDWLEQCIGADKMDKITQFRPPLGEFDNGRARHVTASGYEIATWNVDGNVGYQLDRIFSQFYALPANASVLVRFDVQSYDVPLAKIVSQFVRGPSFRPNITKRFVSTKDCYHACTGGNGVCRTETGGPGVFETFQTILNY